MLKAKPGGACCFLAYGPISWGLGLRGLLPVLTGRTHVLAYGFYSAAHCFAKEANVGIDLGFKKKFNASLSGGILKNFFSSKNSFY